MPRVIQEPITEHSDSPASETVTTHPAFAQIGASRVQGHTSLYDSDFVHQHYMTITIRSSELHRSLNRDWHFGRSELIEVALSESQWATFVSAPNVGMGVPCTLSHINGRSVPGLPDPASRVDQFSTEIVGKLSETVKLLDGALRDLGELGLSKAKQERMAATLETVRRELKSNLPFVAKQFSEHMETTVEKAKQEIHGYMTNVVQRAGLAALTKGDLPLQIEVGNDAAED